MKVDVTMMLFGTSETLRDTPAMAIGLFILTVKQVAKMENTSSNTSTRNTLGCLCVYLRESIAHFNFIRTMLKLLAFTSRMPNRQRREGMGITLIAFTTDSKVVIMRMLMENAT